MESNGENTSIWNVDFKYNALCVYTLLWFLLACLFCSFKHISARKMPFCWHIHLVSSHFIGAFITCVNQKWFEFFFLILCTIITVLFSFPTFMYYIYLTFFLPCEKSYLKKELTILWVWNIWNTRHNDEWQWQTCIWPFLGLGMTSECFIIWISPIIDFIYGNTFYLTQWLWQFIFIAGILFQQGRLFPVCLWKHIKETT